MIVLTAGVDERLDQEQGMEGELVKKGEKMADRPATRAEGKAKVSVNGLLLGEKNPQKLRNQGMKELDTSRPDQGRW